MGITLNDLEFLILLHIYVTFFSALSFVLMGIDKNKAEYGNKRVSENKLMIISFLGGSPGVLIGMLIFKHKTSKKKFYVGIPGIYIVQWLLLFIFLTIII